MTKFEILKYFLKIPHCSHLHGGSLQLPGMANDPMIDGKEECSSPKYSKKSGKPLAALWTIAQQ